MFRVEAEELPNPFGAGTVRAVRASWPSSGAAKLRRGKVRDVYDLGDRLVLYHTDRVSAFDVVLEDLVPLKGVYLCALSEYWFRRTARLFPNHLIARTGERTLEVVKAERIDVEWIVRGYLYGSAWRAYSRGARVVSGVELPSGLRLAEELPEPVLTPTTKSESGHDRELTKEEAIGSGLVTRDEWAEIEEACYRLYEFYRREARSRGIIVADVKLEFGRTREGLIQIDEPPTHDSARLWSAEHYEPGKRQEAYCLDKEFLRAYLTRVGYRGEGRPPRLPWAVVEQVALRARGAYEVLAGLRSVRDLGLKSLDEVLAGG